MASEERPEGSGAHRAAAPLGDFLVADRYGQFEHPRRRAQAAHVAVEEERLAVVRAQRLVHALAVQKSVIEHRNHRVLIVEQPAVDVHHGAHQLSVPRVLFCLQLTLAVPRPFP